MEFTNKKITMDDIKSIQKESTNFRYHKDGFEKAIDSLKTLSMTYPSLDFYIYVESYKDTAHLIFARHKDGSVNFKKVMIEGLSKENLPSPLSLFMKGEIQSMFLPTRMVIKHLGEITKFSVVECMQMDLLNSIVRFH